MDKNFVINIGRQLGSGGRTIAEIVIMVLLPMTASSSNLQPRKVDSVKSFSKMLTRRNRTDFFTPFFRIALLPMLSEAMTHT